MYNNFAKKIDEYLEEEHRALEIGCGTGIISSLLKSNADVQGMDFSRKMIELAQSKIGDSCIQADMEHLPYADHSFDVIFANSTLHHFPFLNGVISEVRRILKSGGYFIVQEPSAAEVRKDMFLRILAFGFRKLGTRLYPNVEKMEVKPSEHHSPLQITKLVESILQNEMTVRSKELCYYSSFLLSGFDSSIVHHIGKILDRQYTNKYKQSYMYTVISQKK
jgi:ubiquinone/menaquinone biosynthesis C-methylase UbiE